MYCGFQRFSRCRFSVSVLMRRDDSILGCINRALVLGNAHNAPERRSMQGSYMKWSTHSADAVLHVGSLCSCGLLGPEIVPQTQSKA